MNGLIVLLLAIPTDERVTNRPGQSVEAAERNSIGMVLQKIPAGRFTMGAPRAESLQRRDETPREVTITRPFLMATTEVTQAQWQAVMPTAPWRGRRSVREGNDYPATYITWDQATAFCHALSQREQRTYRLPTEAEWEFACRGGETRQSAYGFGNAASRLSQHAWFGENTVEIGNAWAHQVAQKRPNGLGLYDMHGNCWEWCGDWYAVPTTQTSTDPVGPQEGGRRLMKGGSWHGSAHLCRCACRFGRAPHVPSSDVGFRVVLEIPPPARPAPKSCPHAMQ